MIDIELSINGRVPTHDFPEIHQNFVKIQVSNGVSKTGKKSFSVFGSVDKYCLIQNSHNGPT